MPGICFCRIIFLSDSLAGRASDVALLVLISASVGVAMLESIEPLRLRLESMFRALERMFTIHSTGA